MRSTVRRRYWIHSPGWLGKLWQDFNMKHDTVAKLINEFEKCCGIYRERCSLRITVTCTVQTASKPLPTAHTHTPSAVWTRRPASPRTSFPAHRQFYERLTLPSAPCSTTFPTSWTLSVPLYIFLAVCCSASSLDLHVPCFLLSCLSKTFFLFVSRFCSHLCC